MTINCKGKIINLETPIIMGILNLTPDSFYDGGKFTSTKEILLHVEKLISDGASFIDIGACSSRPGATNISEEEELKRLLPNLEKIVKEFPEALISIDTFRANVAKKSVQIGACMINDISGGGLDQNMFETIAGLNVPYILMHMAGTPESMQNNIHYDHMINDILHFFSEKVRKLNEKGVNDIILDVGFGFGKTIDQNYELLNNLNLFKHLGLPILAGISRKSMLYKYLNISPSDTLNATTVANTLAVLNGANILRVHDVKEALQVVQLVKKTTD